MSNRVIRSLLANKIIEDKDVEVIEFGLETMKSNLIGFSIILIMGVYYKHFFESIIFGLMVFPLRKYSGGYHARTKLGCFLISTILIFLSFEFFMKNEWSNKFYCLTTFFWFSIIYFLAPIENINKQLDELEKKTYRKKARMILVSEESLFILSLIFSWHNITKVLAMCISIVGVLLLAGKISLEKLKK